MIRLNMADARPIYTQIVDGIKEQVIKGILVQGDQIPSIRQLAGMLTVTPNTVSKAYQELERQGIIISVRGKGNFINEIPKGRGGDEKMAEIKKTLHQVCVEWQYTGCSKEQLVKMIEAIYNELEGKDKSE